MPSPSHRKSLHLCNSEQDTTILLFLGKDSGLTCVVLLSFHIKHCVLSFIDNPEIIRREYDSSEQIKDNQPNHVGTMNESRFTSKNGKSHAWTWDYQKKNRKSSFNRLGGAFLNLAEPVRVTGGKRRGRLLELHQNLKVTPMPPTMLVR